MLADGRKLSDLLQEAAEEKRRLEAEVKRLRKELDKVDLAFFDDIEDLKYNYNMEVKKNIVLSERFRKLSQRFGVEADVSGESIG